MPRHDCEESATHNYTIDAAQITHVNCDVKKKPWTPAIKSTKYANVFVAKKIKTTKKKYIFLRTICGMRKTRTVHHHSLCNTHYYMVEQMLVCLNDAMSTMKMLDLFLRIWLWFKHMLIMTNHFVVAERKRWTVLSPWMAALVIYDYFDDKWRT